MNLNNLKSVKYFILTFCLFIPSFLYSQEIKLSVDPQKGTVEDLFELSVQITGQDDNSDISKPIFEKSDNFTVAHTGQSQSVNIINGNVSSLISYNFEIIPSRDLSPGIYQLPKGSISISGEDYDLKQAIIRIIPQSASKSSGSSSNIEFYQTVSNKNPYVGEQIKYQTIVKISPEVQELKIDPLSLNGFWSEENKQSSGRTRHSGSGGKVYTEEFALFPLSTSPQTLKSRKLQANIFVKSEPKGTRSRVPFQRIDPWLFNYRKVRRQEFSSNEIMVEPKALPARPSFASKQDYIPVGELSLNVNLKNNSNNIIKEDESIFLNLTVSGTSNLNPFKIPELNERDKQKFKLYVNKESITTKHGSPDSLAVQTKTFSIELSPKVSGKVKIPEWSVHYFDPKEESYKTLKSTAQEFIIEASKGRRDVNSIKDYSPSPKKPVEEEFIEKDEIASIENTSGMWGLGGFINKLYQNYFNYFCMLAILATFLSLFKIFKYKSSLKPKSLSLKDTYSKLNSKELDLDVLEKEIKDFTSSTLKTKNISEIPSSELKSKLQVFYKKIEDKKYSKNKEKLPALDLLASEARELVKEISKI